MTWPDISIVVEQLRQKSISNIALNLKNENKRKVPSALQMRTTYFSLRMPQARSKKSSRSKEQGYGRCSMCNQFTCENRDLDVIHWYNKSPRSLDQSKYSPSIFPSNHTCIFFLALLVLRLRKSFYPYLISPSKPVVYTQNL